MFSLSRFSSQAVIHIRNYLHRKSVNLSTMPVGILGAPVNLGQPKRGVEQGPNVIRKFGLVKELEELGLDVKDYGNIECKTYVKEPSKSGKVKGALEVGDACQKISEGVKRVLQDKRRCVTLGGDHSMAMGTIHGHSQVHDICVLWVDAHPDINTSETTLTGHLHGVPLSFLLKEVAKYNSDVQGLEYIKPCLNKANLAYIGLRDMDPLEKLILSKEDILYFSMRDIDKLGIYEVTNRALEYINPMGNLSLHVSFDIDSLDYMIVPSTGTPVHGGMTIREGLCIAEEISKLDSLNALDLVEVNPALGNEEQVERTVQVAKLLIKTFFGYSRHGNLPLNQSEIPTE